MLRIGSEDLRQHNLELVRAECVRQRSYVVAIVLGIISLLLLLLRPFLFYQKEGS